ncbi:MAG: hypothetical protein ACLGGV_10155, partial [Bacteroidia bacterium]
DKKAGAPENLITPEVHDGRLVFSSRASYEKTIEQLSPLEESELIAWEDNLSFTSMRKEMTEEERENIGIEDELLATLINKHGEIQIGKYIYKIDIPNEKVYAVRENQVENPGNAFENNAAVKIYSIHDNVLDFVEGDRTPQAKGCDGCPDNKFVDKDVQTKGGASVNVKYKVVYQKAGVYYSLQAKIKREVCNGCIYIGLQWPGKTYSYTKCGSSSSEITGFNQGGTGREYSKRPYSGSSRLKQYNWKVRFSIRDGNWIFEPQVELKC